MKTLDEVICEVAKRRDLDNDIYHYLKEYQKIEDEYHELKDWWAEEHTENVPLSWDELNEMEGKPVWVKIGGYIGQWSIVHMITPHLFARYYAWPKSPDDPMKALAAELNEENYGKTWKTYRKELK